MSKYLERTKIVQTELLMKSDFLTNSFPKTNHDYW